MTTPRVAVVGHIEWLDFAVVDHLPAPGEIVTAEEQFAVPAGGGAVAAVQLRRLAGAADFFTVVGDDELGARSVRELRDEHGLDVHAVARAGRGQRRAFTHLDRNAERTITVLGERLVPRGGGAAAVGAARRRRRRLLDRRRRRRRPCGARRARAGRLRPRAGGPDRRRRDARRRDRQRLRREGARGDRDARPRPALDGRDRRRARRLVHRRRRQRAGAGRRSRRPATPVDAYGCGDSFAAGLTYGLGAGLELPAALTLAARCGAWCLCGRGPYGNQLGLTPCEFHGGA